MSQAAAAEVPARAARASTRAMDEGSEYARLLGQEAWWRLAPAIRERFSERPARGRPIRYLGTMQQVRCSWAGWLLARFCRLLGTPFAPHRGSHVPVAIELHRQGAHAVEWRRCYRYRGRPPVTVSSVKRIENGSLLECTGMGLGMRLAVFEANRALHFLSLRYFCTLGGRRIWLPAFLAPGQAHVIHTDLGGGRFRFSMSFHHPLFGALFFQDGVFQREPGVHQ